MADSVSAESWLNKAKAIAIIIAALTTGASSMIAAYFGAKNHETGQQNSQKLDNVQSDVKSEATTVKKELQDHADDVSQKLTSVKTTTDKTAKKVGVDK